MNLDQMIHAQPAFCCFFVGDAPDAVQLKQEVGALLPECGVAARQVSEASVKVTITHDHALALETAFAALKDHARAAGLSHAIHRTAEPPVFRLAVMDMDSTLIRQEVIEELAEYAGVREQVERVTTAAMEGKLNFQEARFERVKLLEGQPVSILDEVLETKIVPSGGFDALFAGYAARGIRTLVVSGGFIEIVGRFAQRRGVHRAVANTLEVADGRLTGRVLGEVVDRSVKRRELLAECAAMRIDPAQAIAIGDGANDLDMMSVAGLGVAFCAKPIVQQQALAAINRQRLDDVLGFFE